MVQIGYDRDAGGASPRGCDAGCGRVVSVDVKQASRSDPFSLQESGRDGEAGVAPPDNGALA